MYSLTPKHFTDYFRQSRAQGALAVVELWQMSRAMFATQSPTIGRMYDFLEPLYQRVNEKNFDRLWPMDSALIGLFDAELAKAFAESPLDVEIQEAVAAKLILLSAAIGKNPGTVPYKPEELAVCLFESTDLFEPEDFVATVHRVAEGEEVEGSVPVFLAGLEQTTTDNPRFWTVPTTWEATVLQVAQLHTLWNVFFLLNDKDQQFLLQSHLYQSVVAGVPVYERIAEALETGDTNPALEARRFLASVEASQEPIPLKTDWSATQSLSLVVHAAEAEGLGDGALSQDQYVRQLYQGQDGRDSYGQWLREVVGISNKLRAKAKEIRSL